MHTISVECQKCLLPWERGLTPTALNSSDLVSSRQLAFDLVMNSSIQQALAILVPKSREAGLE